MTQSSQLMGLGIIYLGLSAMIAGCNSASNPQMSSSQPLSSKQYLLTEEPSGAQSVLAAKDSVKDGDEITILGRIGGSAEPFVNGRAAFTVVDMSLVPCNEREGDSCPKPWDYCCDVDTLPKATAVLKIVDGDGQTVPRDAKRDLGLRELQTVVARGKAKRDDAGNLTVLAKAIFVKD
jgi:hypothetical protein